MSQVDCPLCGASLVDDVAQAGQVITCPHCSGEFEMPQASTEVAPALPVELPPPHASDRRKTSRSTKWGIALILVVVLCGGVGVAYYAATEPGRVEDRAARQLKLLFDEFRQAEFPSEPAVKALENGYYGKHKFTVHDASWTIAPNVVSSAYPFRGVIEIEYTRYATISHATKAEAESDEEFFVANYGTMTFPPDRELAKNDVRSELRPRVTCTIIFWYDIATDKWVEQSRRTQ